MARKLIISRIVVSIKKAITISLLSASAIVAKDFATVSDKELKEYMYTQIINGEIPVIDVSKADTERAMRIYAEIATEGGAYDEATDNNVYSQIRRKEAENGVVVLKSKQDYFEAKTLREYKEKILINSKVK